MRLWCTHLNTVSLHPVVNMLPLLSAFLVLPFLHPTHGFHVQFPSRYSMSRYSSSFTTFISCRVSRNSPTSHSLQSGSNVPYPCLDAETVLMALKSIIDVDSSVCHSVVTYSPLFDAKKLCLSRVICLPSSFGTDKNESSGLRLHTDMR